MGGDKRSFVQTRTGLRGQIGRVSKQNWGLDLGTGGAYLEEDVRNIRGGGGSIMHQPQYHAPSLGHSPFVSSKPHTRATHPPCAVPHRKPTPSPGWGSMA